MKIESTWKPVVGFEGLYSVSNLGEIRSNARTVLRRDGLEQSVPEQIKTPTLDGKGYLRVALYSPRFPNGSHRTVHSLVAEAFIGPRPDGMQVLHGDGDRTNPSLANLSYGTSSANHYDTVRHGMNVNANKTHCSSGHVYDDQNTYVYIKPNGVRNRQCRACNNSRRAARAKRNRQAAA